MRKCRLTEQQIIGLLQQAAPPGAKIAELLRRHGISPPTCYAWRREYSALKVDEAKRLRALEDENRRLKRVVADQALNIPVLKDLQARYEPRPRKPAKLEAFKPLIQARLAEYPYLSGVRLLAEIRAAR